MSRFWYLALLLGTSVTLSAAAPVDRATSIVARGVPCAYMETKSLSAEPASVALRPVGGGDMETIWVRYLGHGTHGCAYDVLGGYQNPSSGVNEDAIYKAKRLDYGITPFSANEIQALQDNNLLWGLFSDDRGSMSGIMKKQPGKFLYDTQMWKQEFPANYLISNPGPETAEFKACEEFILNLRHKVIIAMQQFGAWDPYDVNWENFLWSDDLEHVVVVDLGSARPIRGDLKVYWKNQELEYLDALENFSEIPVKDNKMAVQGVCFSNKRRRGEPWKDVFKGL